MMRLDPNIAQPDRFYAALIRACEGRTDAEAEALILRLVFLLANQLGDDALLHDCLAEAIRTARERTDNER